VKSAELIKSFPLFFLASKDKGDLLLEVAHDKVVLTAAVDLKFDVADTKGSIGQVHQESFRFGCYP
jgi:hypothetical protein